MMHALGATNDAELARFFGVGPATISAWRARGVSKQARRTFAQLRPDAEKASEAQLRRVELGHQVMYEGLCLALWLAPSIDSLGKRFGAPTYSGILRNYASYFREIELACAEHVAERLSLIEGNAADALESLTRDNPEALLKAVLERAEWWRYGYLDQEKYSARHTLHDPSSGFRYEEN